MVQTDELTEGQVRDLEGELEALCSSVDDVFARPASRENLRAMVRGLLSEVPRKNLWRLAEAAGHPNPDRLQGFLAKAAWDAGALRDRVRAVAVASLAADDAVLIADETGDIKKGTKTAGVQRQYTGTAGRIENAQVSVHLSYGSRRGRTLIDAELYLGRNWAGATAEHERRCAEQGIPPERATAVAAKPELARQEPGAVLILVQGGDPDRVAGALGEQGLACVAAGLARTGHYAARESLHDARAAAALARRRAGRWTFAELWPMALADESGERLEPLIGPLAAVARSHPHLAEAVRAFADHGFTVSSAARTLSVHPNTLSYRLERWQELTGAGVRTVAGLVASRTAVELVGGDAQDDRRRLEDGDTASPKSRNPTA